MSVDEPQDPREPHGSVSSEALEALAEYLRRVGDGEKLDFSAFCAERPEMAKDLEIAYLIWQRATGLGETTPEPVSSADPGGLDTVDALKHSSAESARTWAELIERISSRPFSTERYRRRGELGAGAMGRVADVWDRDLRRRLAMKVMHVKTEQDLTLSPSNRAFARFLEEAQVTAQLDHPGIVPIHELGLDDEGRPYFTMKRVKGIDLSKVYEQIRGGSPEWNEMRALGVLLRVCEAMAFAHSRGVVHRDLKPANIMVGRFGEAYVMDWGLVRVVGRPENGGRRAPDGDLASVSRLWTDKHEVAAGDPDSPLVTADGDILGTPAYMAPEQATGVVEDVGPPADVYAVGAMLYELYAKRAPYADKPATSPREVWQLVLQGPPMPVERAAAGIPAPLAAICEKAMARRVEDRYANMSELGDELRAFLEDRVVRAHRTGALIEFRKWCVRNRATAAALAGVIIVALVGLWAVVFQERRRSRDTRQLLDVRVARELVEEADDLGPMLPGHEASRRAWLERARAVVVRSQGYRSDLQSLRELGTAEPDEDHASVTPLLRLRSRMEHWDTKMPERRALLEAPNTPAAERTRIRQEILEYGRHQAGLVRLENEVSAARRWTFGDPEVAERHAQLADMMANVDRLAGAEGLIVAVVEQLDLVAGLYQRSIGDWSTAWEQARQAIRSSPKYGGLELAPQIGLVPLHENSAGLWEFWHVLSGERPQEVDGQLIVGPETGIVMVLLPGTDGFVMGSTDDDPASQASEKPAFEVALDPFFVGKYEVTTGQWLRVEAEDPNLYFAGSYWREYGRVLRNHPVEQATWFDCERVLRTYGLSLPTEAQFEYAIRGGTHTPHWWTDVAGFDENQLNFLRRSEPYKFHWRVDSGPTNPLGLYNVAGNVSEWCLDWHVSDFEGVEVLSGSGEIVTPLKWRKAYRGGSYINSSLNSLRSARRSGDVPSTGHRKLGFRSCRRIDP